MRILLANANTTTAVTELCVGEARRVASAATEIVPVTGAFGAAIINSRAENTIAGHALLDALASHQAGADGVVIAVSYDTALFAAREMLDIPVVGMTEASLHAACLLGSRFGLVTFGTPAVYRELVEQQGLASRLAGIRTVTTSALDAYTNPHLVLEDVARAANEFEQEGHADVVILCGAAMAGMGAKLQDRCAIPLVDGISPAVSLCEMLIRLRYKKPRVGSFAAPFNRETIGLSSPLAGWLKRER